MTTCFAFDKFGASCTGDITCSVDGDDSLKDGTCVSSHCTYSCYDGESANDEWCPEGVTCEEISRYCTQ
jgi:hypothetical protein